MCKKGNKSREKKKDACPISYRKDCPYMEPYKECKWNKEFCHRNHETIKKKKSNTTFVVLISILILLIIIFVCYIIYRDCRNNLQYSIFDTVFLTIMPTFIAGTILSLVIDIPNRLKEYESSFLEAITSDEYLKKLSEEKLTNLRKRITDQLHKKDVPNMPGGVIKLDEEICQWLKKPFYKWYRQSVKCKMVDIKTNDDSNPNVLNSKYIEKEVSVEYLMYNPYYKNKSIAVDIGFRNHILKEDGIDIEELFEIKEFSLQIDKQEEFNLMSMLKKGDIDLIHEDLLKEIGFYNKHLFFCFSEGVKELGINELRTLFKKYDTENNVSNDESSTSQEITSNNSNIPIKELTGKSSGLNIIFNDRLSVKLKYTIKVPIGDLIFTKRLKYPVKYFRLDYNIEEKNSSLYGELIGTLIDESSISKNLSKNKRYLSIETFDWLLPKNGVAVVIVPQNTFSSN